MINPHLKSIYDATLLVIKDKLDEFDSDLYDSVMELVNISVLINNVHQERIICSAIHIHTDLTHIEQPEGIKEGFVVCGRRHGDCYKMIANIEGHANFNTSYFKDSTSARDMGFITNTNRFVHRKEALKIAMAANQLTNPKLHEGKSEDDPIFILTSEDLFLDVE